MSVTSSTQTDSEALTASGPVALLREALHCLEDRAVTGQAPSHLELAVMRHAIAVLVRRERRERRER